MKQKNDAALIFSKYMNHLILSELIVINSIILSNILKKISVIPMSSIPFFLKELSIHKKRELTDLLEEINSKEKTSGVRTKIKKLIELDRSNLDTLSKEELKIKLEINQEFLDGNNAALAKIYNHFN